MSHATTGYASAAGRPRQQFAPIEALMVKLEELDKYSHIALRQYPKYERHVLTAETRQTLENIMRLCIAAWKRYHKKTTLTELDVEVAILRHRVRKALNLGHIDPKRYTNWSLHIDEFGRMVGGWIRHERAKRGATG